MRGGLHFCLAQIARKHYLLARLIFVAKAPLLFTASGNLIQSPHRSIGLGRLFLHGSLRAPSGVGLVCALLAALAVGCHRPSNRRNWSPNQAVLPWAELHGDRAVTVHNIRDTVYRTAEDYNVRHYDRTYDLNKLDELDFIIVPLPNVPGAAHTFVSFGFEGKDYLAISVEIRRQKGEEFSPLRSLARPYELMYVVGNERDLIELRSIHWLEDVYMYKADAPRADIREMLIDMLARANKLKEQPEFYNLVTNNCVTNVVDHVNNVAPGSVPYTYQVLLPGYFDRLAYDRNLIKIDSTFERTKQQARVNELAYIYRDRPDFSVRIRQQGLLAREPLKTTTPLR